MGDGARKGGGGQVPPHEATPTAESPAFLPRKLTPNQLFGSGRGDQVVAERQAAANQIQRTLRVWRKASSAPEETKGADAEKGEGTEVSEPGDPAEREADTIANDVADKLHGDGEGKEGDGEKGATGEKADDEGEKKEDEAGKEQAPAIGAKLDGIGRKIFLSRDDDKKEEKKERKGNAGQRQIPPKTLPGFPGAQKVAPKTPVQGGGGMRARWQDGEGNIYEWDYQHGTVEKYNKRGKHLGEFDANTGAQTKPADKTRSVDP